MTIVEYNLRARLLNAAHFLKSHKQITRNRIKISHDITIESHLNPMKSQEFRYLKGPPEGKLKNGYPMNGTLMEWNLDGL